ncbi:MAG: hypothetical protein AMJ95_07490 [Omnitrophica WOR_2 bacterium SM23_72]|nr:MAG: hypothetical protein AMJ95_07490 [Omnitrophica WOR_2 bacterium SM23_72]
MLSTIKVLSASFILIFWCVSLEAGTIITETEYFVLSLDTYLRLDSVTFKNTVDLDSSNKDDSTAYLGLDYSFGFNLESKDKEKRFFLKLERNGPCDYSAPLFVHNTLMTSAGPIDRYRNEYLLPQIEEFWMDIPLLRPVRLKIGLYTYEVGNGFSLHGCYENLGLTLFTESEGFSWRFHYSRPDLHNDVRLGPRIRQEQEQDFIYEPNAANFFALDCTFKKEESFLQPYIGALVDYTSAGKRDNYFTTPTNRDILGTVGMSWTLKQPAYSWSIEAARNFGEAKSASPEYKDVQHTGFLVFTQFESSMGNFTPYFAFLAASGNKVSLEQVENLEDTLTSSKNRAFSCYSPLNNNLDDSVCSSNADMLPIVAMGGGYGLNYGVPRPGTFAAADFDNLLMPQVGFDFKIQENLTLGVYGYYLSLFERPVGLLNGVARYLSRELGSEIDLFLDYQFNENTLISLLGGYFFPGRYYKELRSDTDGSLLSPFVRGDGEPDSAYQVEIAVEFTF